MLRHVPAPRRHELLYSVFARCGRYLQAMEAGVLMRELMGSRWSVASVDLPGHLAEFVRGLPVEKRTVAIDRLIDNTTIFPFHTSFVPAGLRLATRAAMHGDMTGVHTRLGITTFRVRPPERLRFCPVCLDEMESDFGDLWWRRDHQLPGILVCPDHGKPLRFSEVDLGAVNRHLFVSATRDVCGSRARAVIEGADPEDLARMADLARGAASLLTDPPAAAEYVELSDRYRSRLADVGLMRSPRKVDHRALAEIFRERWGGAPELIPGLELHNDPDKSWLSALVRTGRRAAQPLQHVMLRMVLDGLEKGATVGPFGLGPWPCRNPAASHYGAMVIDAVEVRRDGCTRYGDFLCSCGYLYTRTIGPDGVIGPARYRRFGPLFEIALKSVLARGDSLRASAAALGLDPKTLMREALSAGISVPWNLKPSGALRVAFPESLRSAKPKARRKCRPKRNWFAIDTRLTRSASQAAGIIRAATPPVRVTFATIERRIARRDWIIKRKSKLPQTMVVCRQMAESTDEFRSRRLAWFVSEAASSGDLRPCAILRVAGLPMKWLPQVRIAISDLQLRGGAIAA